MEISTSKLPRISVVIPTFNRAQELKRCLDSLVCQTYKNFEVIVCDDGSTDDSKNIVDGFINKLDLSYVFCENFGGPAKPRNLGVQRATSPYIAFLDSDDWWSSDKLHVCASILAKGGIDLIYHDMWISNPLQSMRYKYLQASKPCKSMWNALLTDAVSIPNSSVVLSRELLLEAGGISEDKSLISVEDYDTWIRIASLTDRFYRVPLPLGFYSIGENNISAASTIQIDRINYLYCQYFSKLSPVNLLRSKNFLIYRIACIYQANGKTELAKTYFLKVIFSAISLEYRLKSIFRYTSTLIRHNKDA